MTIDISETSLKHPAIIEKDCCTTDGRIVLTPDRYEEQLNTYISHFKVLVLQQVHAVAVL